MENGLWRIDPRDIQPLDDEIYQQHPEYSYLASVSNPKKYEHYENILFMSTDAMLKLKKSKAVNGLKVSMKDLKRKRSINPAIALGSMTRTAVSHKKKRIDLPDIGHTVQCDVYGKVRTPGLSLEQYYAFFIDKGGGMNGVYTMKTKDEMSEQIKKYIAYKRSINNPVLQFESDQGKEILNESSKKWLIDNSININTASAYKHEHTPHVNAHIRYTMNLARAMMIYCKNKPLGFRKFLHPYAVRHANWIRNRSRLTERNGVKKTRYEWSTGKKPDISNVCYWGCLGYRKVPPELRVDKQNDKATIGYFMGYDINGKGSLIYVPGKKKVILSGDFIFDELAVATDALDDSRSEEISTDYLDVIEGDNVEELLNNNNINNNINNTNIPITSESTRSDIISVDSDQRRVVNNEQRRSNRTTPKVSYKLTKTRVNDKNSVYVNLLRDSTDDAVNAVINLEILSDNINKE
jgi:hypothetical protein